MRLYVFLSFFWLSLALADPCPHQYQSLQPLRVLWRKDVPKQLDKTPDYVRIKFHSWVALVRQVGLREARKVPGYHDEPIRKANGELRSVRLNRAYRVFYIEHANSIEIIEVNRHEY